MSRGRFPHGTVAGCLFLSGAGSLVLEVCWSRLLKLVFGSTTLSISTILVAYMLGLGLGGWLGGRLARRFADGVRTYATLEFAIGAYALAVPLVLALYPALHHSLVATLAPWPAAVMRFVLALAVLIAPTLLMGATLPVVVAFASRERGHLASDVAVFYGVNTLGAVTGVLLSTFVLFGALGVRATNATGAALDIAAGALALVAVAPRVRALALAAKAAPPRDPKPATGTDPGPGLPAWLVPATYGIVGFTALTFEVAWTRTLTMVFGSSTYAFAAMLATFLVGIGAGSLAIRLRAGTIRRPAAAYGVGLAALGVLAFVTLLVLRRASDLSVALLGRIGSNGAEIVASGFGLSALAMLGPTLVLGALFPLVVRAADSGRRDAAATVGNIYFANTLGSAAGAFFAGFVLIPGLGLTRTIGLSIALDLVAAAAILLLGAEWARRTRLATAGLAVAAAVTVALVPPALDPAALTRGAYYHPREELELGIPLLPFEGGPVNVLRYYRDGITATVSVHDQASGRTLRVNGKSDAGLGDMPTQSLLGHVPLLFGRRAQDVLVIGYGSGCTVGAVTLHAPRRVDVVEIEPAVVEGAHLFDEYNRRPLSNPATHLVIDDGRSFMGSTRTSYDVIVSEPSNPFLAGSSSLFTREFFTLAKRALRPGGRLLQWVQLYGLDPEGMRSVFAAMRAEFRYVYGFHYGQFQPDLLVMASDRALGPADLPHWEQLSPAVRESLEEVGLYSTHDLWSLVRLLPDEIDAIAGRATRLNTDDSMFVELRAPWLMFEATNANFDEFDPFAAGALGILGAGGSTPGASDAGGLALAYQMGRGAPRLAERSLEAAGRAGESAAALTASASRILTSKSKPASAAVAMLDRAIVLDPALFEARYLRARVLQAAGRVPDALLDADALVAARPGDPRARRLRIRLLTAAARESDALDDVRAMLAAPAARFDPLMWMLAAQVLIRTGHAPEAIPLLERYVSFVPFAVDERALLAEAYERAGRTADAARTRRDRDVALENNVRLLHRAARFEARFGSAERARALFDELLAEHPDYGPARADRDALP